MASSRKSFNLDGKRKTNKGEKKRKKWKKMEWKKKKVVKLDTALNFRRQNFGVTRCYIFSFLCLEF